MRVLVTPAFVVALVSLLAACGAGRDAALEGSSARDDKVLHVYNWADYIGESTIADFEARTGIKVDYDVFDSGEVLVTKLLTGSSGYDIVVPSGAATYRLIQAGVLKKLESTKLRNRGNLDPAIMRLVAANDPGNEHAVPYLRGTTGIGYNPDQVEKALGTRTIDGLSAVFDPAAASRLAQCGITWLDSPADMFQAAFIYLGLDAR